MTVYGFKHRRDLERSKQAGRLISPSGSSVRPLAFLNGPENRVRIRNSSGHSIPGGGLVVASTETYAEPPGEGLYTSVLRPSATVHSNNLLTYIGDFDRTLGVPGAETDGMGWGSRLQFPEWVLATEATVSPGDSWGPQANSFLAKKGNSGLIATGASRTVNGSFYIRAQQVPAGSTIIRGELQSELTIGGSALINKIGGGQETVWDYLLTAGQTVASGKKVIALQDPIDGKFYVVATSCP